MGPRREACTGDGSRDSGVQVLRALPGGGGAPGGHTPWSSLAACTWERYNHRMTGAGPLNQRFSNCTVSRTHLGSRNSESVGLGRDKILCSNSFKGRTNAAGLQATLRTAEPVKDQVVHFQDLWALWFLLRKTSTSASLTTLKPLTV